MTFAITPIRALDWPPPADPAGPDPVVSCEWLVANGLGGYASGTVSGVITRRYHGLLIAALPAPLGRVDVVLDGEGAWVSWLSTEGEGPVLRLARISPASGAPLAARTLSEASASRAGGVPRMARAGDVLMIAWTEPGPSAGESRLRAVVLSPGDR